MPKKRKQRMLKTLKLKDEPLFGSSNRCTEQINVNIQYIWEICKGNEDKFIKIFSKTYTHEMIHMLIGDIIEHLFEYKEEFIIRHMLKEKWDKEIKKYYKKLRD